MLLSPYISPFPSSSLLVSIGLFSMSGSQDFCLCSPRIESLLPPALWKYCNQILLDLKVRFPGFPCPFADPQTEKPDVGLRTFTKVENFFGIIVLQFVDSPPGGYGIWFYHDCAPPILACCGFFFAFGCGVSFFGRFQCPPVNGCSIASCNFYALEGGDEHTFFYSTILNFF